MPHHRVSRRPRLSVEKRSLKKLEFILLEIHKSLREIVVRWTLLTIIEGLSKLFNLREDVIEDACRGILILLRQQTGFSTGLLVDGLLVAKALFDFRGEHGRERARPPPPQRRLDP